MKLARPWWEKRPEKFQFLVERLNKMPVASARTHKGSNLGRNWHSVPALVVRGREESESFVRVLIFRLREGKLRLRFRLESPLPLEESSFEATFISETGARALFTTTTSVSPKLEFSVDTELPTDIARDWGQLKITDTMPFRLILFSLASERVE